MLLMRFQLYDPLKKLFKIQAIQVHTRDRDADAQASAKRRLRLARAITDINHTAAKVSTDGTTAEGSHSLGTESSDQTEYPSS